MNTYFIRALQKFKLLNHLNLHGKVQLNNQSFNIPILNGVGYSNLSMSEPWMIQLLRKIQPKAKGCFVDVGMNIGQTLLKLRSVSKNMEYVGFEPNPYCMNYLNELKRINKLGPVAMYPVGISEETSTMELNFYSDDSTDSSASIIPSFRPKGEVYRKEFIPIFNVDDLKIDFNKYEGIGIIKIDVEGAELGVLLSFKKVILEYLPLIMIEILPVYRKENSVRIDRQLRIENELKKWGYNIYRVIKKNKKFIGLDQIEEIGIHSDINLCEYVFVPKSVDAEF